MAGPARAEDAVRAHYAGYAKGLNVFDVDLAVMLHPADYRLQASFRLTGVLGALIHADGSTVVNGRFAGVQAVPLDLFSTGQFRGEPHVTQIRWQNGTPQFLQMIPPTDAEREPVAASDQAHTIDAFSAVAAALHQVAANGTCDTATRTFDGQRLSQVTMRTVGQEQLPPTDRSSFQGPALRCDVTALMVGGFMRDEENQEVRRPKQATVWAASLAPGQPAVPVRITFYNKGEPAATLYLAQPPKP